MPTLMLAPLAAVVILSAFPVLAQQAAAQAGLVKNAAKQPGNNARDQVKRQPVDPTDPNAPYPAPTPGATANSTQQGSSTTKCTPKEKLYAISKGSTRCGSYTELK